MSHEAQKECRMQIDPGDAQTFFFALSFMHCVLLRVFCSTQVSLGETPRKPEACLLCLLLMGLSVA